MSRRTIGLLISMIVSFGTGVGLGYIVDDIALALLTTIVVGGIIGFIGYELTRAWERHDSDDSI